MFRAKIKNQLNFSFLLSLILTLVSIFTANTLVGIVSNSYEDVIDNTLPVMKKNSNLSVISKDILVNLDQIVTNKDDAIIIKNIDQIIIYWSKLEHLILTILNEPIPDDERIALKVKLGHITLYKKFTPQFRRQIILKRLADQQSEKFDETIQGLTEYSQKTLLTEMELYARKTVYTSASKSEKSEVNYAYGFYKNSTKLIGILEKANNSHNVSEINTLKIKAISLFNQMRNSGKSKYNYKQFADSWLAKVAPIYAGEHSIFKVRYDVLRLGAVLDSIVAQQTQTVKDIETISDSLSIKLQSVMESKKQDTLNTVSNINYVFLLLIILSISLSFVSIWIFVNKSLLIRLTKIREKILKLSKGDVEIQIEVHKNDELGDMEDALGELKLYVEKAKKLSTRDSLTGLLNHGQFKQNLSAEIKRNARQKVSISLAIIDIDYFKEFNDSYGHPKGDKCLKKISKLIKQTFKRTGDSCYRIGGEEFAILMVNTNSDIHKIKIAELQSELLASAIKHEKSNVSELLTISVGIYGGIPLESDAFDDFYSKADIALYKAKNKRNTIVIYQ
jgi:diguanylate cyclase (GGDEF)-like protein